MEDSELKNIWKEYDRKIQESKILNLQSWVLNLQSFEFIKTEKAKSKLNALSRQKKWMIWLGFIWVFFLVFLIVNSLEFSKIFFVISAGSIALCTSIAIVTYIRHVILIKEIDNTDSLVETQRKTAFLQTSTLKIVRILFLQFPFYSIFFWTPQMITSGPIAFWTISFPIAIFFIWLSAWLFRNISFRNANKRWFKVLFSGSEWTSVTKALGYLNEINEFRKEKE